MTSKRHRFGVKLFVLCDCYTGFVLNFMVYSSKQTEFQMNKKLRVSGTIVMTLMKSYLGKGHAVFVDNW